MSMTTARGRVPFLPPEKLTAIHANEFGDDRFRAAARARQSLYREANGWPCGVWPAEGDRRRQLGSYLGDDAGDKNFISPEVARLAHVEVAYREPDALIEISRLFKNMLSSMPATFNLLGPLALNQKLASSMGRRLFPDLVKKVNGILFETSPARRDARFTNCRTSHDAVLQTTTREGSKGFVAFETKFVEGMNEQPARLRPRWDELSQTSNLFLDPDHPALRQAPLQQLWREHMLAYTMMANGLYSTGRFVLLAPALNTAVQDAAAQYRAHLRPDGSIPFDVITFEQFIATMKKAGDAETADKLFDRYCNWEPIDALVLE